MPTNLSESTIFAVCFHCVYVCAHVLALCVRACACTVQSCGRQRTPWLCPGGALGVYHLGRPGA